jgi:hypothetical protein
MILEVRLRRIVHWFKMHSKQKSMAELPIAGGLTSVRVCTVLISVLMGAVSAAGIMFGRTLYLSADLRRMFIPNDVVNLCVVLPFLLVALILIGRSQLIGLLGLAVGLLVVLYNYLIYLFALAPGILFPLHLVLVILSGWAMVRLITRIDASSVAERIVGAIPARATGGILAVLGVLFLLRALGVILGGVTHHASISRPDLAVNSVDLLITPLWVSGGLLLIFRKVFGYVMAPALLFQASMLFLGLIAFLFLQPFLAGAPFHWIDVIIVFAMGLTCFVPLVLFLLRSRPTQRP